MKFLGRRFVVIGLLLGFNLSSTVIVPAQKSGPEPKDVIHLLINGRKLSGEEADKLEKVLSADSNQLSARISLIAYYANHREEPFKSKKNEQALWFIRNMPDSEILHQVIQVRLNPVLDSGFLEAKQLWLANLDKYKGNTKVIGNAFDFFSIVDKPFAEKLVTQAAQLEPANPKWLADLGQLLMSQMYFAKGETRRSLAARAYQQFVSAYSATTNLEEKAILLSQLSTAAFEAGDLKNARTWALEALNQGGAQQGWPMADPVHHAHIVLGRIALVDGDVAEAKQRLLQAGTTSGSPVLKSFGPNMILAKELIEKGEGETVIKYFEECATFWKDQKLQQWTAKVRAGEVPDFGANLAY